MRLLEQFEVTINFDNDDIEEIRTASLVLLQLEKEAIARKRERRRLEVPLSVKTGEHTVYPKVKTIKEIRTFCGIGLKDAKALFEDCFQDSDLTVWEQRALLGNDLFQHLRQWLETGKYLSTTLKAAQ